MTNPFCSVADSFCTRENDFGKGGKPTFDAMFHGEKMGFFGGVEWLTPIDKLTLKAEISSDAYTREQQGPNASFERKSPVNFGAEYRLARGHHRSAATTCTATTVGFNVVVSRQPLQAAHAAEPRPRPGAGQPAAGGRQLQHRLGRRSRRRATS